MSQQQAEPTQTPSEAAQPDGSDATQSGTQWSSSFVPGLAPEDESAGHATVAPSAVHVATFDLVLRGYDRHQVDRYVADLTRQVEQLREEVAQSHERELVALQQASRAKTELDRGRPTFDALGERVTQLLGLAEAEAAAMREAAERAASAERSEASKAAAILRSDAQREAERTLASARSDLVSLEARRDELLDQVAGMRDALDRLLPGGSSIDLRQGSLIAAPEPLGLGGGSGGGPGGSGGGVGGGPEQL